MYPPRAARDSAIRRIVTICCAVSFLVLNAAIASAVSTGTAPVNPPTGGFAIDGNLQANVATPGIGDWTPGASGSGGFVLSSGGLPIDPTTTYHLTDLFNSGNDDNFAGGQKFDDNPNTWSWVVNPVTAKNDMNNAGIHFTTDPSNGHVWVAVFADRYSNNGDAYIDFEFLQNTLTQTGSPGVGGGFRSAGPNGGRTVNDFLLTLSLTKGGSTAGFAVSQWQNVGGGLYDYVDR